MRGDNIDGPVSVFLDRTQLGSFKVQGTQELLVEFPGSAAQVGSFLRAFDSSGSLLFQSAILHMTYARGNVVEEGEYCDNRPDMEDVLFLYEHVFSNGPAPAVFEQGDVDASGRIDVEDVLILHNFVLDQPIGRRPRIDMTSNGRMFVMNVEVGETADADQDEQQAAGGGKSTPPQPGQGAVPVCLDGDPRTKEWAWPDCTVCLEEGKKIKLYSWGPADPNERPTGANSCFQRTLECPDGTSKQVGKCVFADGLNSFEIDGCILTHTCKNRGDEEDYGGHTFKECGTVTFKTDIKTCKQTICLDTNGDGVTDHVVEAGLEVDGF